MVKNFSFERRIGGERNESAFEKLDLKVATDSEQRRNCWGNLTATNTSARAFGKLRALSCHDDQWKIVREENFPDSAQCCFCYDTFGVTEWSKEIGDASTIWRLSHKLTISCNLIAHRNFNDERHRFSIYNKSHPLQRMVIPTQTRLHQFTCRTAWRSHQERKNFPSNEKLPLSFRGSVGIRLSYF